MAEYNNSKIILEHLGAQDPNNFHVQSSLASNLDWIGIITGKQGDHVAELQALREAQARWERLHAREPRNPSLAYFIMENHNAIGDALQACGDTDSALAAYREVRSAEDRLVPESKSQEIQLSRVEHLLKAQLVRSYQGVGEVLRVQGDFAGALEAYRTAQAIVEPLAEQSLDKSLWQSSLEVSYLGIIHVLSN